LSTAATGGSPPVHLSVTKTFAVANVRMAPPYFLENTPPSYKLDALCYVDPD
jgi:hypothetical protein